MLRKIVQKKNWLRNCITQPLRQSHNPEYYSIKVLEIAKRFAQ